MLTKTIGKPLNVPLGVMGLQPFHIWEIVIGDMIQGDFGPTAVNTKLGWLLSGPVNGATTIANNKCNSNLIKSGKI